MRTRFTEEQILAMIKEQEACEKTTDVCRRHGISSATFYNFKLKYGGMQPPEAKRLKVLEDGNGKLKKLLGGHMLDNAMLRDINSKKVTPVVKRKAVLHLIEAHQVSQRRTCKVLQVDRSLVGYLSFAP